MAEYGAVNLFLEQQSAGPNHVNIWLRLDGGSDHILTEKARQSLYAYAQERERDLPGTTKVQLENAGLIGLRWDFTDKPVDKATYTTRTTQLADAAKDIGNDWTKSNIRADYPSLELKGPFGKAL